MLRILKRDSVPLNKEIEDFPWYNYFENQKVTKYLDDSDANIVKQIERTSLINNSTIYGKFSDMPIGIGELSDGCKTLLSINHAIKNNLTDNIVFNITSCGGNAIDYLVTVLAKDIDIYAIIEHSDLGYFDSCNVEVHGKIYNDWLSASNELI